jgi:hypothetical protein
VTTGAAVLEYTVEHRPVPPAGTGTYPRAAAPYGVYRCAGRDQWCVVAVTDETEWAAFRQAIGDPAWTHEPRFATMAEHVANRAALDERVTEWTRRRCPDEVMYLLQKAGCPAAVVLMPALLFFPVSLLFEPRPFLILLILGVGCTAAAHTLFIAGLGHMTAQLASLLVGLEPVWGIALGLLILGEVPTQRSLAGGVIIVGATLLPAVHATGWPARRCALPSSGRST